jgi:hypothetical protein
MVESKSHAQRRVRRWCGACLATQSLRVASKRNVQAWRSVLRRPAHRRASAAGSAPRSRWAVRPLAASAPQCLGQQRNASAHAVCGISFLATAGIGRAAPAGGCFGSARRVRTVAGRPGVANAVLFAQAWRAMTANPYIERTNNGGQQLAVLRASGAPLFAAHVERYASAAVRCFSNVGLVRGLRARSEVPRALRMRQALSVLARFAPQRVRGAVLFACAGACSDAAAVNHGGAEVGLREQPWLHALAECPALCIVTAVGVKLRRCFAAFRRVGAGLA